MPQRSPAPITLFVYNRPLHTKKVLDTLSINPEARHSILYIYCDGPKSDANIEIQKKIAETRLIAKTENRFKEVFVVEQLENKGLANSIIDGVTEVVNRHGTVIVLEDDIVTSPGFLKYMNDALKVYENETKVMHISGYILPVKKKLPETFFYKPATCWGWATWARAWKYFEKNAEKQIRELTDKGHWKEFTVDYSYMGYKSHLEANLDGRLNTWAIFWYASIFLAGGTSLHPYPSLVQNIGTDGSGIHSGGDENSTSPYTWENLAKTIVVEHKVDFQDKRVYRLIRDYQKPSPLPVHSRIRNFMSRVKNKLKSVIGYCL